MIKAMCPVLLVVLDYEFLTGISISYVYSTSVQPGAGVASNTLVSTIGLIVQELFLLETVSKPQQECL